MQSFGCTQTCGSSTNDQDVDGDVRHFGWREEDEEGEEEEEEEEQDEEDKEEENGLQG